MGLEVRQKEQTTTRRVLALASIICFLLIAAALLIAHGSPTNGYELSLYTHTPTLVWVFLIISSIGGVAVIIHQAAIRGHLDSQFWLVGLLILLVSRVSIIWLPYARGYYSWQGDHLTHVGIVKSIIADGHISADNWYPATHTMMAQLSLITGIPHNVVCSLGTGLLSVIFVLSIYLLATEVLPQRRQQLVAVAMAGSVMFFTAFFDVYLTPNGWSVLLLPLVIFLYFRRHSPRYAMLLVIVLVLYVFLHPLSALLVIIALALLAFRSRLFEIVSRHRIGGLEERGAIKALWPSMFLLGLWVWWIWSFEQFQRSLAVAWEKINASSDVVGQMGGMLGKAGIGGVDVITLTMKLNGVDIILVLLSLVCAVILFRRLRSKESIATLKMPTEGILGLVCIFLSMGWIYLLYLAGLPGLEEMAGERVIAYTVLLSPILAAFAVSKLLGKVRPSVLGSTALVCIIAAALILGLLRLYPSPYIVRPNTQVTRMDIAGMTWSLEKKDEEVPYTDILSPPFRFADAILGPDEAGKRADVSWSGQAENIPDHFNYGQHQYLRESYEGDRFAAITMVDRLAYVTVWEEVGRFDEGDFERLEQDPTVARLYSNGGTDVYFVRAAASEQ